MPSFDIVNELDMQEVDNAVNMTRKMVATRYDFRKSRTEIILDRKPGTITITTEDSMKLKAVQAELSANLSRRKIDLKALKPGEPKPAAGDMIRLQIDVREGIDTETARKIVKLVKGARKKVQAAIQEQQVRVSGKKIDDLQAVIAMLKEQDLGVPLQFVNMRN